MMKTKNFITGIFLIAVLTCTPCFATVLTMDVVRYTSYADLNPPTSIPDGSLFGECYFADQYTPLDGEWYFGGYGDYVDGPAQGAREWSNGYIAGPAAYHYGVGTEGYTPNTRVYFDSYYLWQVGRQVSATWPQVYKAPGFGDLPFGISSTQTPLNTVGVNFYTLPGIDGYETVGSTESDDLVLYDLDLAYWLIPGDANTVPVTVAVYAITLNGATDGSADYNYTKGAQLFTTTVALPKNMYRMSVPINLLVHNTSGPAVRLEVTCAPNGGNVGVSNIRFGEQAALPTDCTQQGAAAPAGDLDGDCKVNFKDFAKLAASWLSCNNPAGCP